MKAHLGGRGLVLAAATALTLSAVPQGGAGGPIVRHVATYKITVTAAVTTERAGSNSAENFRGTARWTHTYPRVSFERYTTGGVAIRGNLRGGGRATGTAVARYDHQGEYCGPNGVPLHESGTLRGPSTLSFGASYPLGGRRPYTSSFNMSSVNGALGGSAMNRGDIPTCTMRHEPLIAGVGVAGHAPYVSAGFGDTYANLAFVGHVRRLGIAGFPLDPLLAGKGFSYSNHGTNRNTQQTRDNLSNGGYAYLTDGSVKVVFTPVG